VIFGSTSVLAGSFDLSSLDGSNGFVISAGAAGHWLGDQKAAAGDVNGDGIADV